MIDQRTVAGLGGTFSLHSTCLPKGVESISIGHDTRPDGVHTTVIGIGQGGRMWVLSHTVAPIAPEQPLQAEGVNFAGIRGTKVVLDEVGRDDEDEVTFSADDVTEHEDGRVTVTNTGLSHISGLPYLAGQKWLARSGLTSKHLDLADIEREMALQVDSVHARAKLARSQLRAALRMIRAYLAECEAVSATTTKGNRAAVERARLLKAISEARYILDGDEVDELLTKAVRARIA